MHEKRGICIIYGSSGYHGEYIQHIGTVTNNLGFISHKK